MAGEILKGPCGKQICAADIASGEAESLMASIVQSVSSTAVGGGTDYDSPFTPGKLKSGQKLFSCADGSGGYREAWMCDTRGGVKGAKKRQQQQSVFGDYASGIKADSRTSRRQKLFYDSRTTRKAKKYSRPGKR